MSSALRVTRFFGSTLIHGHVKPMVTCHTASLVTVAKQTPEDGFIETKPFPYKTKRYTRMHVNFPFLDPTDIRMNKNSKIVCVESNMGSQKSEVAQGIAKAFGLYYMPEPRIEDLYINDDGFDYRTLNQYIHPKLHAIDEKMYYENPHHPAVPWLKIFFYQQRYIQYLDALAHLFNTGQGVVLERSVASDFVFTDAMHKCGFLPKDVYDYYFRLRYDTIHILKRPHLVIYLDTDVDVCLNRIKSKGVPYLTNSKVITKQYLEAIEESYKSKYLDDANRFSELLIFKWNKPQPLDNMILQIEGTNMDDWDIFGDKFRDWNFYMNRIMHESRYTYTSEKRDHLVQFCKTLIYDVESFDVKASEFDHRNKVYESLVPGYGQPPQFNYEKNGFFKALFGWHNKIKEDEYELRAPFY